MRFLLASALCLFVVCSVPACGPRVTNQNIEALNAQYDAAERGGKTLTIKEAESILGQPTKQETFPIEMQTTKELQGVRYFYTENGRTVVLHFIDNKLIRRAAPFGGTLSDDPEMRKLTPAKSEK